MKTITNTLVTIAVAALAADIIYELNKKHNVTGRLKAKFSK